eukprot:5974347-Prymnesium_polylepis.1
MLASVSQVRLCWHCQQPGHAKKVCVDYIQQRELPRLLPRNSSNDVRDKVEAAARVAIEKGIAEGKSGIELRFGGRPGLLYMEWPSGIGQPPYPTPGVWDCGTYCGDDG